MQPYRIASPPAPVRTEEADSYEARLLAGRRRFWAQMALMLSTAITLGTLAFQTAQRRPTGAAKARRQEALRLDEARHTTIEARVEVTRAQKAFDDGLHVLLARGIGPSVPLTACETSLGEPERLVRGRAMVPLLVIHDTKQAHYWSPSVERVKQDVETAEALLQGGSPSAALVYTNALESTPVSARLKHDVVLVADKWHSPQPSTNVTFDAGSVDGMAYVFDFDTRRFVCAGEVHASSSKNLQYSWNELRGTERERRFEETLADDLELQIARAVTTPGALYTIE